MTADVSELGAELVLFRRMAPSMPPLCKKCICRSSKYKTFFTHHKDSKKEEKGKSFLAISPYKTGGFGEIDRIPAVRSGNTAGMVEIYVCRQDCHKNTLTHKTFEPQSHGRIRKEAKAFNTKAPRLKDIEVGLD